MEIHEHILLAPHTTFKVGGYADSFCSVTNVNELREALVFATSHDLPIFVLGGGSNVLISDDGFHGLVIQMGFVGVELHPLDDTFVEVSAGAGENWDALVARAVEEGLYGIENLSGIPGSVGATPIQNVGAYGAEVRDSLVRVEAFDPRTMAMRVFENSECAFGYRDSFFKSTEGSRFVITRVIFQLATRGGVNVSYKDVRDYFLQHHIQPSLTSVREAILSIRARKFPDLARFGTAGSFFKNPVISEETYTSLKEKFPHVPGFPAGEDQMKVPAAWLIEHVGGFRGTREGAVGSFENQALVIVNSGGASSREILLFAERIAQDIRAKTGIALMREVRYIGEKAQEKSNIKNQNATR